MKAISTARMQRMDRQAVRRYGMPVLLLMENAGRAVAEVVQGLAKRLGGKRIIVLCGSGHNGGDGVVAARYLNHWGYHVSVWWIKNPRQWEGDIAAHFRMANAQGVPFKAFARQPIPILKKADVLIDALLGTGTKGEIHGLYQEAIQAINLARRPVVAVDIPSGLDSDSGKPLGLSVRATITVTMAMAKKGLIHPAARPYVGRLLVADIGMPISKNRIAR